MSKWIWYDGDFELYHGMLIYGRRERSGSYCPTMYRVDTPLNFVTFEKTAKSAGETITVRANTPNYLMMIDGKRIYRTDMAVLEPGEHTVTVKAFKPSGIVSIFIEGDAFSTDGSWTSSSDGYRAVPAGCSDMFASPDSNPEIFPFEYRRADPVASEEKDGGILYDFGRETFGKLNLIIPDSVTADIYYGESVSEALNRIETVITDTVTGSAYLRPRAFRYIFICPRDKNLSGISVYAEEEFIPRDKPGYFTSDDEEVNKVVDVCTYTLELNMREAIFDGIKRDRWVWSGDAYQSYVVNYYSFFDLDSVRRTTRMLRGRDPMTQHINNIPDYSVYWLMGIRDYYLYSGDSEFVKRMYHDMVSLVDFIRSRLDENGFIVEVENDFLFIDWHNYFDREGPLCAVQILLWAGYLTMAELSSVAGEDGSIYYTYAEELKEKINRLYWNESKGAFVDSFISGKNNVTRHANIFALMYGLADGRQAESIIENVIKNKTIPAITTPYFKFFELDAMLAAGDTELFRNMLHTYWGEMLRLGATTVWEEFDPTMTGDEHYAMYGLPFEKSLCHAWGASPVYLLGRYALGVYPTAPGYAEYEIKPCSMGFGAFEGAVPTPNGIISVKYENGTVTVRSDISGGTLVAGGERFTIPAGKSITAKIQ